MNRTEAQYALSDKYLRHLEDESTTSVKYKEWFSAAQNNELDKIIELHNAELDIDAQDHCGFTALAWASYSGYVEITKFLIAHKANQEIRDNHGWTALMWARHNQRSEILELFFDHNTHSNDN